MQKKTFLVFDAVGTIIRPRHSISGLYQKVGAQHAALLSKDVIKDRFQVARERHFGNRPQQTSSEADEKERWKQIVADVFLECHDSRPIFDSLWELYASPKQWMLFDDVADSLDELLRQGRGLAIASNFDQRLINICKNIRPLDQIVHVYCSSILGFRKPDIRFFQLIKQDVAEKGVLESDQTLTMIGDDGIKDVQAAIKAGWEARHIDRSKTDFPSLLQTL